MNLPVIQIKLETLFLNNLCLQGLASTILYHSSLNEYILYINKMLN